MSPLTNMFAIRANPLGILQGAPAYRKNPDEEILYGPNSRQAELNPGWTNNSGDVTKKSINEYYAKRPINMETVETDYPFLADPNFQVELNNILSQNPNINKKDIYQIMSGESSFNPTAKNPDSSATGLFQFIESTANNLGTTTDEISKMTPAQQLNLYGRYVNNYMRNSEKSPDFVININEDGSYEDFDEEAFEKMFPPLNKNAQNDSNNIVSVPIPTYKPTEREADVLKRAQDVNQQFNNEKNDMINAEKGYIPQQTTYSPPNRAGNKYSQRTGLNAVDYNGTVNPNVVYDSQGNPYDTTYNNKQEKYDPTGGQQQSRQDLAKLANFDISTIDGKEFVHERGLTEEQVMAEYYRRNESDGAGNGAGDGAGNGAGDGAGDGAGNGVMPTGVGILQDMSNAVEVPFNQSEERKPNNLRYLAGLLGSIMADRYGNPSQPEDNFSKYMKYTQDAIEQQRLDKQALESTIGNYTDSEGNIVLGGVTPGGGFQLIPEYTAIDGSDSNSGFPKSVAMGNDSYILMDEDQYTEHKKNQGKKASERVEKLSAIRQSNFENSKDFNELLAYSDDDLNKLFGQGKYFDTQLHRDMVSGTNPEYKSIRDLWEFISDKRAKEAYVNILKGAGSISNYETDIMAKTINNLKVTMPAAKLKEEIAKIQFLGQFHEHNTAAGIPNYSDSKGTYKKLNTKEAYRLFLKNEIKDLNDYLNYKNRQK